MSNPLIAAYRKPALYIALPSNGKFYKNKPKLSIDGELAVYSMTAKDELITKSPDALFNGEATSSLIKSCCPDIADPNDVPVNDLLVILVAIRQASYGTDIDINAKCPECEFENALQLNTNNILATTDTTEKNNVVELENGFKLKVKPYNLKDRTLLQIQQIKQTKMITSLASNDMEDEQKQEIFGKTFVEIAQLTVNLITNAIESVSVENDLIEDKETIREWLQSITKKDYDIIKDAVDELSRDGISTDFNAQCQSCNHTWKTPVDLDIANFFEGL